MCMAERLRGLLVVVAVLAAGAAPLMDVPSAAETALQESEPAKVAAVVAEAQAAPPAQDSSAAEEHTASEVPAGTAASEPDSAEAPKSLQALAQELQSQLSEQTNQAGETLSSVVKLYLKSIVGLAGKTSPSPEQGHVVDVPSAANATGTESVATASATPLPVATPSASPSATQEAATRLVPAVPMERGLEVVVPSAQEVPRSAPQDQDGMHSAMNAELPLAPVKEPEHQENHPADHKELLIAVVTSPLHYSAREAIRRTYAVDARKSGRADVKFFVGLLGSQIVDREQHDHEISGETDMVRFSDYVENYHNLSSKALDIFKWAVDNGYQNVFKVDDDTYVRVPLVLEFLDAHQSPYLYAGDFVDGRAAMIDNPNSKWYMKDQYPYDRLEDYANGPGVILGRAAITFLHDNFDSLFHYRVDDAAIAIWLKDLPLERTPLKVDHYAYTVHDDTVWINPVNSHEMLAIHKGYDITLQICLETCLCWGYPEYPNIPDCMTWDRFLNAGYTDMVPRLAFV